MLPDPTMATDFFCAMDAPLVERHPDRAQPGEIGDETLAGACVDRPGARPGQDDVAGLRRTPKLSTLRASQATAVMGIAENGVAATLGDHFAVRVNTASIALTSMSFGETRSRPSTKPPEDALSAMVSHRLIFQS